jgi:peroxiredoxin
MHTGPEIGEKVPDFSLTDQYGKTRALGDLTGRDGLLLVFSRSALW